MSLPLSVVVVAYNIERELPRTLRSLSAGYQRDIAADDYEVLVVDNGSATPIDESVFEGLDGNFRLLTVESPTPSPLPAVNLGLRAAQGETVGVMIDGGRMVSPGLLSMALAGSRVRGGSGVVTLGWYLGFDYQRHALGAGWTQADEDRLLQDIEWPADGYRLFEVSSMDESSVDGWLCGIFESNGLFLPASVWATLGGFDEAFDAPGGGLANYDALWRATQLEGLGWVILLGEATFHQLHRGIATSAPPDEQKLAMQKWTDQYRSLRGRDPKPIELPDPVLLGSLPELLWPRVAHALNTALYNRKVFDAPMPLPVPRGDQVSTDTNAAVHWTQRAHDAAARGLDSEAQGFARLAREAGPLPRDTELLLAYATAAHPVDELPRDRHVQFLVDGADALAEAGEHAAAEQQYREVLRLDPGNVFAYVGLSRLSMPGPDYYDRLERLHEHLNPASYLEIGVFDGVSLKLAKPPTIAVAVDPDPHIQFPIPVECHLYRETSGDFFSERDVRGLFGGRGPELAFIDGLHSFPAVLDDFANVEAIAEPDTVIVLHDMLPFDEITQRAERVLHFYTGDVWKLLHCFAEVRPDLSWFTIRTPPSGLTFVSGLDPSSTLLRDRYDELVEQFGDLDFERASAVPGDVVENDWEVIRGRVDEWRAKFGSDRAGPMKSNVRVETADAATLARRVRELEDSDLRNRRELDALQRTVRRSGLPTWMDPDSAQAELERLRRTKLFRAAQPFRRLYAKLRFRRPIA